MIHKLYDSSRDMLRRIIDKVLTNVASFRGEFVLLVNDGTSSHVYSRRLVSVNRIIRAPPCLRRCSYDVLAKNLRKIPDEGRIQVN